MLDAQTQYKKNTDKDVSLLNCYDAWMKDKLNELVEDGRDWVDQAIDDIKTQWKPKDSEADDPLGNELFQSLEEILQLLDQDAQSAIDSDHFDLDLDDMDTSD